MISYGSNTIPVWWVHSSSKDAAWMINSQLHRNASVDLVVGEDPPSVARYRKGPAHINHKSLVRLAQAQIQKKIEST